MDPFAAKSRRVVVSEIQGPPKPVRVIDPDDVPAGPAGVVLDWVGTDVARAHAALSVEIAQGTKARKTLMHALQQVIDRAAG